MLGFIVLIIMSLAILSGGLLALFAGRRWYAVWLGFAAYFFITRILDLALFKTPEIVRNWGGLLIALLVVVLVVFLRDRVIRFVPPIGGFIVGAMVAERLLGIIDPEAGKFLFFAFLLLGGLLGFYLFSRRLDFDNAVIMLSALWGASYISKVIFDVVDVFLISFVGTLGTSIGGFLDTTLLLQTLLWLGLTLLGIFVQRKLGFKPLPVAQFKDRQKPAEESQPVKRRGGLVWVVGTVLLVVFLVAIIVSSNNQLSKSIRTSLTNLERSLGLEAEAPGDAPWDWTTTLLRPQLGAAGRRPAARDRTPPG